MSLKIESNDIRVEFLENNRSEITKAKNIQLISSVTYAQVSERDQPLKNSYDKVNVVLQTLNEQTTGKHHRSK